MERRGGDGCGGWELGCPCIEGLCLFGAANRPSLRYIGVPHDEHSQMHRWANGSVTASASVPGADGGSLSLRVRQSGGLDGQAWWASGAQLGGTGQPGILSARTGCVSGEGGGFDLSFALPSDDFSGSSVSVVCDE